MKTLAITLAILFGTFTMTASDFGTGNNGKGKTEKFRDAVTKQVNKHLFFNQNEATLAGAADVMLQVLPEGDVQVILIQTKNPLLKKFIENQVAKMKVGKDQVVTGQILKYRFVFKARN